MRFVFYVADKDRNWGLAEALRDGARVHGDAVEIVDQRTFAGVREDADGGACLGVKTAARRLLNAHLQAGKRFLLFDKGFMRRSEYLRVSVDDWQPTAYFRQGRPPKRFERLNIKVEPRRPSTKSSHIIFANSSQKVYNFHGVGDATLYATRCVAKIRRYSQRPIVYRPKPSWAAHHPDECPPIEGTTYAGPETGLRQWLDNAHLLVTFASNAAFDALAAGVPAMVCGSFVWSKLGMEENFKAIETPTWPTDDERRDFFADLAYCQWTVEEYRSGEAWREIRRTLERVPGPHGIAGETMEDVIALYREMHRSPKYYRGREGVRHFAPIGRLILETESKTLLDYGSGKGEQYGSPHRLGEAWGVEVACYDPGWEPFAEKPTGRFDAVICLDVMEHVPKASVDEVLRDVLQMAKRCAYFSIATTPAGKMLPDGRNAHLTIAAEGWWRERIEAARQAVNSGLRVEVSFCAEAAVAFEDDEVDDGD